MALANKVCLIAGASGAIGTAVAKRFSEARARLILTYLSRKPEIVGPDVLSTCLDITNWKAVQAAVTDVRQRFGTIDVLVNCTGVLGPIGPTSSIANEEWIQAVETNLVGSFYLTRAVLPVMLASKRGKIVHFSGGGAAYARPFFTAYGASKAALVRFTESLAEELRNTGIDANIIAPGPVNSRMWDRVRAAGPKGGVRALEELRKMEETGGVPADRAAALAVFLASERSNGLTGRLISAVHDDWEALDRRIPEVMLSEAGTLRRVPLG